MLINGDTGKCWHWVLCTKTVQEQNMRAEERVLEVEETLAKRMKADLKVLG